MNRAFALTIGLVTALVPATVRAQTNIDQGKSASQIFSNACAECHKSASGLGKGKSAATVAEFLREHYTTGREQAAALAAYVVGGRDTVASPSAGKKSAAERPGAATTEAPQDKRHVQKPPKPEEGPAANARSRRPGEAEARPREEPSPGAVPSFMNPVPREPSQNRPAVATRNRHKEQPVAPAPEAPQEPAAVAHVPPVVEPPAAMPAVAVPESAHTESPPQEAAPATAPTPTAAAPMEAPSGESGEPVPRDNIPD